MRFIWLWCVATVVTPATDDRTVTPDGATATQSPEEDRRFQSVADRLPFSPLSGLGVVLGVVIVTRVGGEGASSRAILESAGPLVAIGAVVAADRWFLARGVTARDRLTVFAYGMGGFLAASIVTGFHLHVLRFEGVALQEPLSLALLSGTIGIAAGTLAGYYEIRQRAAVRETRRQRDRFAQFAAVVSHDLRNPLSVAKGRLHEARDTGDATHLHVVEDCLDRMESLVDDTLSVARNGATVTDPEPYPLAELAEDAWEAVDTGDTALVVDESRPLAVEKRRACRLFENLFRNAIEHGDAETIRVEAIATGFAVEDDGSGLPDDLADSLFERGVTTDDGAGLGLAIVSAVADAHSWSVTATASDDGGARFEFRQC